MAENSSAPGLGVDARGGPVIDPTANVLSLVEAAVKRLDDLNEMQATLMSSEMKRMESEAAHIKDMLDLREDHAKEMRISEAARLDSIRQVDVSAVRTEANRALEAIQTLAATTARDAETLRNALVNTASTIASQTTDTVKQITERLAALERSNYEGVGRQRIADPQMDQMLAEMKTMREAQASGSGRGIGANQLWTLIVGLLVLGFMIYNSLKPGGH